MRVIGAQGMSMQMGGGGAVVCEPASGSRRTARAGAPLTG